tara:strand:+ start:422 stop:916 length:495 start_codon:yes stop_codon:yes gene_type:complete
MDSKLATILLSVIAGLISAPIISMLRRLVIRYRNREQIFSISNRDWHEKFIDEDTNNTYYCSIKLNQNGHSIKGELEKEIIADESETEKFSLKGEFIYNFLIGTLRNIKNDRLGFGVFLLQLSGGGNILKGMDCWYSNGEIKSSPVVWFDSKKDADANLKQLQS